MVSAAATENLADTPDPWSTAVGLPQQPGEPGDDLQQMIRNRCDQVGFLPDHRDLVGQLERVVGADLGAEAILERGDDAAAVRVVLRVRRRHQQHVQRQPQGVAADLDVPLLHHVQQRDLDPLGQVGQFVDRHDAAVRARHQAEVNGLRVAERAPFGDLDRVDVTDQVGDRGVRGGQLLGVPNAAVPPADRQRVTEFLRAALPADGDRVVRVLADLRPRDHRRPLVEQPGQRAQQPGLALTALAEHDDVMAGDERPFELRQHGGFEADDARPGIVAGPEFGQQVVPDLVLHAAQPMAGIS